MFGVPEALIEKGVEPFYVGPKQTGWDGQFYYYMSNDLLGTKDTPKHIDAPSYRYQRVGMSLFAATMATLTGQDWVSPKTFWLSYFFLILCATFGGAYLLLSVKVHPLFILLWSLSLGTQITLFNALPDAAADAFLILALVACHRNKYWLAVIPFTFSALSREVYVLFPSFILLFHLLDILFKNGFKDTVPFVNRVKELFKWHNCYFLVIPGVVTVAWYIYIVLHFGVKPSEQAHGILGMPLNAWYDYFISGVNGDHLLVGKTSALSEAVCLVFFLAVLIVGLYLGGKVFFKQDKKISAQVRGIALVLICFALLYASFGPTVIMHYTGYFKALAVFFFTVPFLLGALNINSYIRYFILTLLLGALGVSTMYNMKARILPYNDSVDHYTKNSQVITGERVECFKHFTSQLSVNSIKIINKDPVDQLFGGTDLVVVNLNVKNTSNNDYISNNNFGSVHVSYHWLDKAGKVVGDGTRSALPELLAPGEETTAYIVARMPEFSTSEATLKPSLVQEGCAWFYMADPKSSTPLTISLQR
jgi:hypothetical protein